MQLYHVNLAMDCVFDNILTNTSGFQELDYNRNNCSREFMQWVIKHNVTWDRAKMFNSPPNYRYKLHIDGNTHMNCVKLNIVFNSYNTVMNWYKPKNGYQGYMGTNNLNRPVLYWDREHCDLVHTATVDTVCLINGGEIHDLVNTDNQGQNRHCYSFSLTHPGTRTRVTWAEALELFKDSIIH